jgi:hypothetical protein
MENVNLPTMWKQRNADILLIGYQKTAIPFRLTWRNIKQILSRVILLLQI